jgi:hypothetical protein
LLRSASAFRYRKNFAYVWLPGQYLRGKTAPLVLLLALPVRLPGSRWKQVVEPSTGHFMHHLELHAAGDVDDEVVSWLRLAWEAA